MRATRIFKRLAVGTALLIASLLLINAVYSWRIGRRLEQRLADLRAAGEPTCFADLAPQPIPPDKDATVVLDRAAGDLNEFAEAQAEFFRTPEGEAFDRRQEPTAAQIAAIKAILARYPELPRLLEQAAACEGRSSKIDFSVGFPRMMDELVKSANNARTPARFLRWRMTILLAEGKREEALQAGLAILRLARLQSTEPTMVNYLVSVAMANTAVDGINLVLREGSVSAEVRRQLDEELARQDDPQTIVRVMKEERAIGISASQGLFGPAAKWLPWRGKGLAIDMIDAYDVLLPMMTRSWYETQGRLPVQVANDASPPNSSISKNLIELLHPALLATYEAFNRSTALNRSLRILNGLTAYAEEHGREASDLGDLDLAASETLDPFSGQPLKLKWTEDGWVIYTVFKNGTDDRGDFKDMADWGLAPAGYPGIE